MPRKHRKNVGLLGLGIIGTRAAAGLRAAGYRVYVWNRTVKPAPNFLPTPAEVADVCEIIQLFVADAKALMEVLQAMKEKLTSEHVVVCSATVGPEATVEASRFVQNLGARFIDAPFTGSKLAAERRQLVYYVGGDEATFLRVKPALEATSKAIVRVGGVGDAAIIKVVTNMIAAVSIQALAEALALVKKAGLPPDTLAAALEHNAARSGTMDLKLPKMLGGDYDPHFSLKHMFKDVQLGIQMANALDVDAPAAAVTAGVMFGAINRGWGEDDFATIFRTYEDQSGSQAALPQTSSTEDPVLTSDPAPVAAKIEAGDDPKEGDATPGKKVPPAEAPSHIFAKIFDEEKSDKP
jgi:3-hydroxyisobutyrate dehydrogenase-like beta-hydroxyacid dehydrogenase